MPSVKIYSQPNCLIPVLAYNLQAHHLRVSVISDYSNSWKLPQKALFTKTSQAKNQFWDYVIVCAPLTKSALQRNTNQAAEWKWFFNNVPKLVQQSAQAGSKLLLILPLVQTDQRINQRIKNLLDKINPGYLKIIWIGDVFAADANLGGASMSAMILTSIAQGLTVTLAYQHYLLISAQDSAIGIIKALLSYWHLEKPETWAVTDKISRQSLVEAINKTYPYLGITSVAPGRKFYQLPLPKNLISPKSSTVDQLIKISLRLPRNLPSSRRRTLPKPDIKLPKIKLKAIFLLFFVVALPFFIFLLSVLISFVGYKYLLLGNATVSGKLFVVSQPLAQSANAILGIVDPIRGETQTLVKLNQIGADSARALGYADKVYQQVMGKREYDLEFYSQKLTLAFDNLYTQTSFLENDRNQGGVLMGLLPDRKKLTNIRSLLLAGRDLASRLPVLVSGSEAKTYLVLYQDSQYPRPTGGVIKKLGLVTFENGQLINTQTLDANEIDRHLTGQINPPAAIKNNLDQQQWQIQDSNWDPDFIISAQKAEWFLNKGLDLAVDGVVALNWPLVGNMKLEDIIDNLNKRNIQVYLHDEAAAQTLSRLGWDGAISIPHCLDNCPVLAVVTSEADFGINSASYPTRQNHLKIEFGKNTVNYTLTAEYAAFGEDYKGYLRVLGPRGSLFSQIKLIDLDTNRLVKQVNPEIASSGDFVDAGVLVEVPKQTRKSVVFEFTTPLAIDFSQPGSFGFYWRKQPGISTGPLSVEVLAPQVLYWDMPLAYNTDLESDFYSIASW